MLWIQMILPRHALLAVNNNGMTFKQNDCSPNDCWYVPNVSINGESTERQRSVNGGSTECERSVNRASTILV
jgi:hypothetical protein